MAAFFAIRAIFGANGDNVGADVRFLVLMCTISCAAYIVCKKKNETVLDVGTHMIIAVVVFLGLIVAFILMGVSASDGDREGFVVSIAFAVFNFIILSAYAIYFFIIPKQMNIQEAQTNVEKPSDKTQTKGTQKLRYFQSDNPREIIRLQNDTTEIYKAGRDRWETLPSNNYFIREIFSGQSNNRLTEITKEIAEYEVKKMRDRRQSYRKEVQERLSKRTLPDDCKWVSVYPEIERTRTSSSKEKVDERSSDNRLFLLYKYKTGYFNPWLQFDALTRHFYYNFARDYDKNFVFHFFRGYNATLDGSFQDMRYDIELNLFPEKPFLKQGYSDSLNELMKKHSSDSGQQSIKITLYPSPHGIADEILSSFVSRFERWLISFDDRNDDVLRQLMKKYEPEEIKVAAGAEDWCGHGRHVIEYCNIEFTYKDKENDKTIREKETSFVPPMTFLLKKINHKIKTEIEES